MADHSIVLAKATATSFLIAFALECQAQLADFKTVNFHKADSIALAYKNETLTNLPELSHKLTAGLDTEVERFRAVYLWVCTNIANDYKLYLKNDRKRQRFKADTLLLENWNNQFKKLSFKKLLRQNRTICTGYAYLVKELSSLANLQCEIIQGYGRTSTTDPENLDIPNHTWNAVLLNGKWYLADATWASGIPHPETNRFVFQYNDGFFFPDPKLFAVNHYPVDKKWLLLDDADKPTFEHFLEAPILYNEAYNYLKTLDSPKTMHHLVKKNETVNFQYKLLKSIDTDQIHLLIDNGSKTRKVRPATITLKNNTLSFEHSFSNTGFYDLHIFIEGNLVLTYTFRVKLNP